MELAVGPFVEGETLAVEALAYDRFIIGKRGTERFATLTVGPAKPSVAVIPAHLRTIEPLVSGPVEPTRTVKLGFGFTLRDGLDFRVNGETHHHDAPVRVRELQVWDVVNGTMMDHPFHLHGFFFQVLSVGGEAPAWRSWEDVVNVPPKTVPPRAAAEGQPLRGARHFAERRQRIRTGRAKAPPLHRNRSRAPTSG